MARDIPFYNWWLIEVLPEKNFQKPRKVIRIDAFLYALLAARYNKLDMHKGEEQNEDIKTHEN